MKRTGRRFMALVLLLTLLSAQAVLAAGKSHIECNCVTRRCECFIQYGDEGGAVKKIIRLLKDKGYLDLGLSTEELNGPVENAIIAFQTDNKLEPTGQMDDETLTLLLWNMTPEQLDIVNPNYRTVYIPVNGGKKRHLNPDCSGMDHPRKVSDRNAKALGFEGCKKCYVGK